MKLKSFLSDLFESPLRNPSTQGNGFVVTVEHCLGAKYLNLSPARPHYTRSDYGRQHYKGNVEVGPINDGYGTNFFHLDESTFINVEKNCVHTKQKYLCSYGTGVGNVSFGVSSMSVLTFTFICGLKIDTNDTVVFCSYFRHKVTREFTPEITYIADALYWFTKSMFQHDKTVKLAPFTSMVVVKYDSPVDNEIIPWKFKNYDKEVQQIPFHTDTTYDGNGKFIKDKNSQLKNTLTVILVLGSTRKLNMRPQTKEVKKFKKDDWCQKISLEHGDLFIIHPHDEAPCNRCCVSKQHKIFYQHGNVQFGKSDQLSIGLVFRVSIHLRLYDGLSGKYIQNQSIIREIERDNPKTSCRWEKEKKMLEHFFSDEKKDFRSWYHKLQLDLYRNCIENRF